MALTQITLQVGTSTRKAKNAKGENATGTVVIRPELPIQGASPDGHFVTPAPVTITVADGEGSANLYALDDTGTLPTGNAYLVQERFIGADNRSEYRIVLSVDNGTTQHLADIAPATATNPAYGGVTPSQLATAIEGIDDVALSQLADIATARILGRVTAGTGSIEELTAAQVAAVLASELSNSYAPWPRTLFVPAVTPATTLVGGWNPAQSSAYYFGSYVASDGAINREIGWELPIDAGTWTVALFCRTGTNRGIAHVRFGGADVATIDMYVNPGGFSRLTATGIVVASRGMTPVSLRIASQNGSSSGYAAEISGIALVRTA